MSTSLFSGAVAAGHTYTTKPMVTGVAHHLFVFDYTFTGGAVAGTLYVDRSSSDIETIRKDQGGDNITDKAVWKAYDRLKNAAGTVIASVTISAAGSDFIELLKSLTTGHRLRFVCSGAGTMVIGGDSRRA